MKSIFLGVLIFFIAQHEHCNGAAVRKSPAFSKPVYLDSYLPAAMQVMFHAIGQIKNLENAATEESSTAPPLSSSVSATSPHPPGQHQPEPQQSSLTLILTSTWAPQTTQPPAEFLTEGTTSATGLSTWSSLSYSAAHAVPAQESSSIPSVDTTQASPITTKTPNTSEDSKPQEIVEFATTEASINAETPEENYATPEINHEVQENVHEMAESNHEMAETAEDHVTGVTVGNVNSTEQQTSTVASSIEQETSTAASVNGGQQGELASGVSGEEIDSSSSEESKEDLKEEGKKSGDSSEEDSSDSSEEEDDEIRFSLIGEKVSQVPRPSLSNYLRKTAKTPLRSSIEELATLYDAFGKEARRRGLAKFSGYSDRVLETLGTSAEGGIVPQLRILLEKTQKGNEFLSDNTQRQLALVLKDLNDPATTLSRDLSRVIPLSFLL